MYHLSLPILTITISSLISLILASIPSPLGIHLGPKYITASLTHANGTVSNIAAIKGSTAYSFILSPPSTSSPPNPALIPKILRTTFAGIKSSADITLSSKIRNVVITLPNHIDHEIQEAIIRAAKLAGYDVLAELKFTDAVGRAYDFLEGGRDGGEGARAKEQDGGKADEGGVTVMVEYNESGLDVWVMDESWVMKPKGHMTFPELGVEAIIDEAAETYFLTVQRRLETTFRKHLVKEDGSVVEGLKGVLLVGDASEKRMAGMKGVLEEVLGGLGYEDLNGNGKGLARDEVEGLYVGSVGAARRGWEMVGGREGGRGRGHEEL